MTTDSIRQPAAISELVALVERLQLGGDRTRLRLTPLTGGVSSNIARLDVGNSSYCLKQALPELRVSKEWLVPVDRIFAEIGWLQTAGEIVPNHVPKIIAVDSQSKSFVMELLPPTYVNWKQELMEGRIVPNVAGQVGAVLGKIHAATANDKCIANRFANDDTFYAIRLEPYFEEPARQHPELASILLSLLRRLQVSQEVLVHGDISPKNILLAPGGPVILDAECACYGDPAFDVAFCLNHLLLKAARSPESFFSLMECFDHLVTSYHGYVTWTNPVHILSRVAELVPALLLARVDGKSPVEYLSQSTRHRVRTSAIAMLRSRVRTLADLKSRWEKDFANEHH